MTRRTLPTLSYIATRHPLLIEALKLEREVSRRLAEAHTLVHVREGLLRIITELVDAGHGIVVVPHQDEGEATE